ncbi:MAG: class I SAM-dependent methyltransferase [Salinarimonas sp.]
MDDLALLADLHADGARQGPGGAEETRLSVTLSGLGARSGLRIADVGCGTGASTLVLADALDARITAIDLLPSFLAKLETAARAAGVDGRVSTREASMEALPFAPGELDAIWSEGAIYNMGFAAGVEAWRGFLKPGGILAVSELTWLTDRRPDDLRAYWEAQYPEVDTASAKIAVLERHGFSPVGYFPLPERCWRENYYEPMRRRVPGFLARHGDAPAARAIVAAEEQEVALYERYRAFFGYGYYVARKVRD